MTKTPKEKAPAKKQPKAGKKKAEKDTAQKQDKPAAQTQAEPKKDGDLVAHLFVGPRDVRVKLLEADYIKVLKAQQVFAAQIAETEEKMNKKDEQIRDIEEQRTRLKAERRDLDDIREELDQRILDMINANKDGHRIERMDVDEIFIMGEIVTYRKGTKEEVAPRRQATAIEWEAAQKVKDEKGRPVDRWQKGKPIPSKPGFVELDGGKVARADASGEFGFTGPDEDPARPKKSKADKGDDKKPKEPRTLPRNVETEQKADKPAPDVKPDSKPENAAQQSAAPDEKQAQGGLLSTLHQRAQQSEPAKPTTAEDDLRGK